MHRHHLLGSAQGHHPPDPGETQPAHHSKWSPAPRGYLNAPGRMHCRRSRVRSQGMARDQHRSAVYAAEDQLRATLKRGGRVNFFGSTLDVPAERHFADLSSIQAYVDSVLALTPVVASWPDAQPVRVRERSGTTKAHYEPSGTIAIPLSGPVKARWAARETVVLHELAHHLVWSDAEPAHGPRFCGALVRLYQYAICPSAGLLLRASLDSAGVPFTEPEVTA